MQVKRVVLIAALTIVLATVGTVAADEAGIITINIFNDPGSQLNTEIVNSTVQGQTNYTNSNAQQNVTLTNSTLTINVNGQNITISAQGDNLTVTTPNQTPPSNQNPNNTPLLSIAFLKSGPNQEHFLSGNASYQYNFNITVGVPTSMNYPYGRNVTHEALSKALMPLAAKYNLATYQTVEPGDSIQVTKVAALTTQVVGGENVFIVFSSNYYSSEQIQQLTDDLYNAFSAAMNGNV